MFLEVAAVSLLAYQGRLDKMVSLVWCQCSKANRHFFQVYPKSHVTIVNFSLTLPVFHPVFLSL